MQELGLRYKIVTTGIPGAFQWHHCVSTKRSVLAIWEEALETYAEARI